MNKKAIIISNYGSMNLDVYETTYMDLEKLFKREFSDFDVYSTYNSERILKKLEKKYGILLENLEVSLERMEKEEYEEVYIQPTYIIPGGEYEKLLEVMEKYKGKFNILKIGEPLFGDLDDIENFAEIAKKLFTDKNNAYIFAAHGSKGKNVMYYGMLAHKLKIKNDNFFTITLEEGLPFEEVEETILDGYENAFIIPLLVVSGHHFQKDINEKILSFLCEKGIQSEVKYRSLLDVPGIKNIYVSHCWKIIEL